MHKERSTNRMYQNRLPAGGGGARLAPPFPREAQESLSGSCGPLWTPSEADGAKRGLGAGGCLLGPWWRMFGERKQ